jgi:hypothetical protein
MQKKKGLVICTDMYRYTQDRERLRCVAQLESCWRRTCLKGSAGTLVVGKHGRRHGGIDLHDG